jgi:hypothetical protein
MSRVPRSAQPVDRQRRARPLIGLSGRVLSCGTKVATGSVALVLM